MRGWVLSPQVTDSRCWKSPAPAWGPVGLREPVAGSETTLTCWHQVLCGEGGGGLQCNCKERCLGLNWRSVCWVLGGAAGAGTPWHRPA